MNMHIYKKLVSFILLHKDFKYENKLNYINVCCDKIQKIATIINKSKNKKSSLLKEECIYAFVNFLTNKQTEISSIDVFFDMLNKFIEQLKQKKKMINEKIIINKLYEFSNENSLDTLIDHIFTY
jgi:hypothetical protein